MKDKDKELTQDLFKATTCPNCEGEGQIQEDLSKEYFEDCDICKGSGLL